MCAFDELLKAKYEGKLYLKYDFEAREVPDKCELLVENEKIISILVNGKEATKCQENDFEVAKSRYDIASVLKNGTNEIVVIIDYYQGENVYYALFGENVTEGLKNCLAYDTEIEPVYLRGDFGVFGSFEKGKSDNIIIGKDFYLGKQKNKVTSLIKDGFPFFAGDITISKSIKVEGTNKKLVINKPFLIVDAYINDEYAGRMMLENSLDISKHLRVGENNVRLTVTVGNRNLLGPFHSTEENPGFVGPDTFERFGSWENGKSNRYVQDYSFLETIV